MGGVFFGGGGGGGGGDGVRLCAHVFSTPVKPGQQLVFNFKVRIA